MKSLFEPKETKDPRLNYNLGYTFGGSLPIKHALIKTPRVKLAESDTSRNQKVFARSFKIPEIQSKTIAAPISNSKYRAFKKSLDDLESELKEVRFRSSMHRFRDPATSYITELEKKLNKERRKRIKAENILKFIP